MELLRALDCLTNSPLVRSRPSSNSQSSASPSKSKSKEITVADKIKACRVISTQLCSAIVQGGSDYSRLLSIGISSLLRTQADEDLSVWTVALETLNAVVSANLVANTGRVLYDLYKGFKQTTIAGVNDDAVARSRRAALLKFSEICDHIRPDKCRKYIVSLRQVCIEILSAEARLSEALLETLSNVAPRLFGYLACYLDRNEVDELLSAFLLNVGDSSGSIRRSTCRCAVSLVQHCLFGREFYSIMIERLFDALNRIDVAPHSSRDTGSHLIQGVLYGFIQLVRLSQRFGMNAPVEQHPVICHLRTICGLVLQCLFHSDHNVVGLSLELLHSTLNAYGISANVWCVGGIDLIAHFVPILECQLTGIKSDIDISGAIALSPMPPLTKKEITSTVLFKKVSVIAAALAALAQIARYFPLHLTLAVPLGEQNIESLLHNLSTIPSANDPLVRGNIALLCGYLVQGLLSELALSKIDSASFDDSFRLCLRHLRRALRDSSSVTLKLACVACRVCLPQLLDSSFAPYGISMLRTLLGHLMSGTQYWVVITEILLALSKVDYAQVRALESAVKHSCDWNGVLPDGISECGLDGPTWINLQSSVLGAVLFRVGDEDSRVREAAAQCLVALAPLLYFDSPLSSSRGFVPTASLLIEEASVLNVDAGAASRRKLHWNIAHIARSLLRLLSVTSAKDQVRGAYLALQCLFETYDMSSSVYLDSFVDDIIPLMLERLSFSWLTADIDSHCDCLRIISALCPRDAQGASSRAILRHSLPLMQHLLRLLNITALVSKHASLGTREAKLASGEAVPLGQFSQSPYFVKLHDRLNSTYKASLSGTSDSASKFEELRDTALRATASVARCIRGEVVPFVEETLAYLSVHAKDAPLLTVNCTRDLFICTFSSLSASASVTPGSGTVTDPLSPTAASTLSPALSSSAAMANPNERRGSFNYFAAAVNEVRGSQTPPSNTPVKKAAAKPSSSSSTTTPSKKRRPSVVSSSRVARSALASGGGLYSLLFLQGAIHIDLAAPVSEQRTPVLSPQDVERVMNTGNRRQLLSKFEPVVVSVITTYQSTAVVELRRTILDMLVAFVRFGVDFTQLDQNNAFVEAAMAQLVEIRPRHEDPHTVTLFPSLMEFLVAQFAFLRADDVETSKRLMHLCSCAAQFVVTHWSHCPEEQRLSQFGAFVRYLYSAHVAKMSSNTELAALLTKLRDMFLQHLMEHALHSCAAVRLLRIVLFQSKRSKQKNLPVQYHEYSSRIVQNVLPESISSSSTDGTQLLGFFDGIDDECASSRQPSGISALLHLHALLAELDPSCVTPLMLLKRFLALDISSDQLHTAMELGNARTPSTRLSAKPVLDVVNFLSILRLLCRFREQSLLSAYDQLYEERAADECADNVIVDVLLKACVAGVLSSLCLHSLPGAVRFHLAYHVLHFTAAFILNSYADRPDLDENVFEDGVCRHVLLRAARRCPTDLLSQLMSFIAACNNTLLTLGVSKLLIIVSRTDTLSWRNIALKTACFEHTWSWSNTVRRDTVFLAYCQALHDKLCRGEQNVQSPQLQFPTMIDNLVRHVHDPLIGHLLRALAEHDQSFSAYCLSHMQRTIRAASRGIHETVSETRATADSQREESGHVDLDETSHLLLPVARQQRMLRLLANLTPTSELLREIHSSYMAIPSQVISVRLMAYNVFVAVTEKLADKASPADFDCFKELLAQLEQVATDRIVSAVLRERHLRAVSLLRTLTTAMSNEDLRLQLRASLSSSHFVLKRSAEDEQQLSALIQRIVKQPTPQLLAQFVERNEFAHTDFMPLLLEWDEAAFARHFSQVDAAISCHSLLRHLHLRMPSRPTPAIHDAISGFLADRTKRLSFELSSAMKLGLVPSDRCRSASIDLLNALVLHVKFCQEHDLEVIVDSSRLLALVCYAFQAHTRAASISSAGITASLELGSLLTTLIVQSKENAYEIAFAHDEVAKWWRRYALLLYDTYYLLADGGSMDDMDAAGVPLAGTQTQQSRAIPSASSAASSGRLGPLCSNANDLACLTSRGAYAAGAFPRILSYTLLRATQVPEVTDREINQLTRQLLCIYALVAPSRVGKSISSVSIGPRSMVAEAYSVALTAFVACDPARLWPFRSEESEDGDVYLTLVVPGLLDDQQVSSGNPTRPIHSEPEEVLLSTLRVSRAMLRAGAYGASDLEEIFDSLVPVLGRQYANGLTPRGTALLLAVLRTPLLHGLRECVVQHAALKTASVARRGRSRSLPAQRKESGFLDSDLGTKLLSLHNTIDEALNVSAQAASQHSPFVSAGEAQTVPLSKSTGNSINFSAVRQWDHALSVDPFGVDGIRLTVKDVCEFRSWKWHEVDLAQYVERLLRWLRSAVFMDDSVSAERSSGTVVTSVVDDKDTPSGSDAKRHDAIGLIERYEAVRTLLLLSDLFSLADYQWYVGAMLAVVREAQLASDWILLGDSLLGLFKASAVLFAASQPSLLDPRRVGTYPGLSSSSPAAAKAPSAAASGAESATSVASMCHLARTHLASSDTNVRIAVLRGVVYLIEAGVDLSSASCANTGSGASAVLDLLDPLFSHCIMAVHGDSRRKSDTEQRQAIPPMAGSANLALAERVRAIEVAFLLIERYPREAEQGGYASRVIRESLAIGSESSTPAPLLRAIFSGLSYLLTAFAVASPHRHQVTRFALRQYPNTDLTKNLLALRLIVTCMYTGEADADSEESEAALSPLAASSSDAAMIEEMDGGPTAHMSNMERVKLLFGEIKQGAGRVAAVTIRVLPRLLLDFFREDQMLLFLLGQFLRQSSLQEYTAHVICDVFAQLTSETQRKELTNWVTICLPNFAQVRPVSLSCWMLTCIFLAASENEYLTRFLKEVRGNAAHTVSDSVFLLAASSFYRDENLSAESSKMFTETFSNSDADIFRRLANLIATTEETS